MLPKAHLTAHSRISGSRVVATPSWLSRSLRLILYSSYVYSCHLFLIFSPSVRSLSFLSFIVPIFAWNVPVIAPIFLNRFLLFPLLLFSSVSLHCLLKNSFLSVLAWLIYPLTDLKFYHFDTFVSEHIFKEITIEMSGSPTDYTFLCRDEHLKLGE